MGGNAASSSGPSKVSMGRCVVVSALGQDDDLVAGAQHAAGDLTRVAAVVGVRLVCGRMTYWTGKRASSKLRPAATSTVSRWCSSGGPSYHGSCPGRSTTLSPCSAEIGNEGDVLDGQAAREVAEVADDLVEAVLGPARRGPSC